MTTLRCNIIAEKSMLGKKTGKFTASLGAGETSTGWQVSGCETKEQASERLFQELKSQAAYSSVRVYIRKGSVTFALFYSSGWCYDIVRDDGKVCSCCMDGIRTPGAAIERMAKHAEQHDGI